MQKEMDFGSMHRYLWNGKHDQHWYIETNHAFKRLLPDRDVNIVCDLFAVTSARNTLTANVAQALKALYQLENDLPFEGYTHSVICGLEAVKRGDPIVGRKVRNFGNAMKGDKSAIVVDMWIMKSVGLDSRKSPTNKEYDRIEEFFQTEAKRMGLQPREMCAMVWSGIRTEQTGKANGTRFEAVLKQKFVNSLFNEKIQTKKYFYIGSAKEVCDSVL